MRRSYAVELVDQAEQTAGPALYQIGVDGGFPDKTAILTIQRIRILLAWICACPARRRDRRFLEIRRKETVLK